jgi:O6-methylguanine-DNA--protein-cysteine methyltransferase
MRDEINALLRSVSQTVLSFGQQYDHARYQGSVHAVQMSDDLLREFAHLGMSTQQEDQILKMVEDRSNRLIEIYQTLLDKQRQVLDVLAKSRAGSQADLKDEAKPDARAQTSAAGDATLF